MCMIKGIGTDIIEIERIRSVLKRFESRFLNRIFTAKEQQYCHSYKDPATHLAGRFAAKEAVAKALGHGFQKQLSWLSIEIANDSLGKPLVHMHGEGSRLFNQAEILITISHCKAYATATALWLDPQINLRR